MERENLRGSAAQVARVPGLYAVRFLDMAEGEGEEMLLFAVLDAQGIWRLHGSGAELFVRDGEKILQAWPLRDSSPAEQPYSTTGNVTIALVELEHHKTAEPSDTIPVGREDAEVIASFFETGGSIRLVDAGFQVAQRLRAMLGNEGAA